MKYAIQVNSAYSCSSLPHIAWHFIHTAITEGNEIIRVFFYHDGIYNGFGSSRAAHSPDWSMLAERYGVDLVLCVSACDHRGLNPIGPLLQGFRPGGLGLWMDACLKADRLLVFQD